MGKLYWLLAGSSVGTVQLLNYVYENELLKQKLRKEIQIIQRMQNFVSSQI
jgi:hypothetical protein